MIDFDFLPIEDENEEPHMPAIPGDRQRNLLGVLKRDAICQQLVVPE